MGNFAPTLVIKCIRVTAYGSYIAETMVPLKSAMKSRKQTKFAGDPVTIVKTIIPGEPDHTLPNGPSKQQIPTC